MGRSIDRMVKNILVGVMNFTSVIIRFKQKAFDIHAPQGEGQSWPIDHQAVECKRVFHLSNQKLPAQSRVHFLTGED